MKKLITLGFFALALLLSTQNGFAQDEKYKTIENNVKAYTVELKKTFSLDENQSAVLERAILSKEKGYYDLANNTSNTVNVTEIKSRIDSQFKKVLLKVVSEDEFNQINTWLNKHSAK